MIKMKVLLLFVVVASSSISAGADESSNIMRDAQALAECIRRLDGDCALPLIYADGYMAISPEPISFQGWRASQLKYFQVVREHGGSNSLTIHPPTLRIKGKNRSYAFLPCEVVSRMSAEFPYLHKVGFQIAISDDDGKSWMFMEAFDLTTEQIKLVVPEYDDQPLPPVKSWREPQVAHESPDRSL